MKNLSKAKLKLFTSLQLKKFRYAKGRYFVEGKKMLEEAVKSHAPIDSVIFLEEQTSLVNSFKLDPEILFLASPSDFQTLSTQQNPEGILTILRIPALNTEPEGPGFLLDRIQDPGNLGTIIRTADWFGLKSILCSPGTVDCYNPKVLRSSMGSIFRVKVIYLSDFEEFIRKNAAEIIAADLKGIPLPSLPPNKFPYLLMGNEANGLSDEIRNIEGLNFVHIPGKGGAESLNVGISAGILAYAAFTSPGNS